MKRKNVSIICFHYPLLCNNDHRLSAFKKYPFVKFSFTVQKSILVEVIFLLRCHLGYIPIWRLQTLPKFTLCDRIQSLVILGLKSLLPCCWPGATVSSLILLHVTGYVSPCTLKASKQIFTFSTLLGFKFLFFFFFRRICPLC